MELDASFYKEEVRCDFAVTAKRKRVWAAELNILERFDEVCKKYNLSYFGYYGTLLGAVRHKGFIPWDDDIDVAMFRDDYERLKTVAPMEFEEPYFCQSAYPDSMLWPFAKIRDSRTTAIEFPDNRKMNQGIFIDIFPLDDVPDDKDDKYYMTRELQKLLWCMITDPDSIISGMEKGRQAILDSKFLMEYMQKDLTERFKIFEEFNLAQFGNTEMVNFLIDDIRGASSGVRREWHEQILYVPFEGMQLPIPSGYDMILTHQYGDYHRFVMGGSAHEGIILDPDISYREYFRRRNG